MSLHKSSRPIRLTSYGTYDERGIAIERCPNCHNERIGKTPRRKGGPSMFHCKKCGFIANLDQVYDMHRLLGHTAA